MPYNAEEEMYPDVVAWLEQFLRDKFKRCETTARDTHHRPLNRVIEQTGLIPANRPEWPTYDIRVDVTGFIISAKGIELVFAECKLTPISLRDISQLLGYSRVALPVYSCILSPAGISGHVASLLQTYSRYDILQYEWPKGETPRSIMVATWNQSRLGIDYTSMLPPGHPFHTP